MKLYTTIGYLRYLSISFSRWNFCEFLTREHKFNRCTQKPVLKVRVKDSKDLKGLPVYSQKSMKKE